MQGFLKESRLHRPEFRGPSPRILPGRPAVRRSTRTVGLFAVTFLASALLTACAPQPPRTTLPVEWHASPNHDARRPNLIVLHHTGSGHAERALATLTDPGRKVSAHYLVRRDGGIVQLVEENARAWHAGQSWWGGQTDLNSASIGIELDNDGDEDYPEAQIDSLLALLADLRERHAIPAANIIGHADVAPARKVDPGVRFPWARLARAGFGLWCEPPLSPAPEAFDPLLGLNALGYDPAVPEASMAAFLRHFAAGREVDTEETAALLHCLLTQRTVQR